MNIDYCLEALRSKPCKWLITGVAGFIGSNLLKVLLELNQIVVGIDNFSTGSRLNLKEIQTSCSFQSWARFEFYEGDVRDVYLCKEISKNVDYVLHQAALGSVPRSILHPIDSHDCNAGGLINMLVAAKDCGVRRVVFASSSSVYGDHPQLPKVEKTIGNCLSPYAVSKRVGELYSEVFHKNYSADYVGLRYFNVFGPLQNPYGVYAAVIPKWIKALSEGRAVTINGDGTTSRDFCYVKNVVQANILASCTTDVSAVNEFYNIAVGQQTSLAELYAALISRICRWNPSISDLQPIYENFRIGDVKHSNADIGKARELLGYCPTHNLELGLDESVQWYLRN